MIVYHCMASCITVSRSFVAMRLVLWVVMQLMMMVAVLPFLLEELLLQ